NSGKHGPPLFCRVNLRSTKHQAPSTRKAPNPNHQPRIHLGFAIWCFPGAWRLVLGCFLLTCVCAHRAAWPQFLGPDANGTSTETGLLPSWSTNGPPMVWDKKIGAGYGAPSVRGNRLV